MSEKCRKLIVSASCILVVSILLLFVLFYRFDLDFKMVYSCTTDGKVKENTPKFICIKDPDYNGFFDKDFLKQYNVSYSDWDLNEHTYIITFGYELRKIEFSYSKCVKWDSIIPGNFQAFVTLSKVRTDKIYIYELKKIDLESAFPDGSDQIVFQE